MSVNKGNVLSIAIGVFAGVLLYSKVVEPLLPIKRISD